MCAWELSDEQNGPLRDGIHSKAKVLTAYLKFNKNLSLY